MSPEKLRNEIAVSETSFKTVVKGREDVSKILKKEDNRVVAIVGPCSIHDYKVAMDYAKRLNELRIKYEDKLVIIMRVYFEKPRTTVGWKGMILDPDMDGSCDIEKGLKQARELLNDINEMGLPCATETLDPIIPQYTSDLVSWAAIGARTTESQTHREMASGLSMPVGFKNGTDGNIQTAIDALVSSRHSHSFIGIDQKGMTGIFKTKGNSDGHIILRGGRKGPNYHEEHVEEVEAALKKAGIDDTGVIIDCSHANSGKDCKKQSRVLKSIITQKKAGDKTIVGLMLESNINAGQQSIPENPEELKYGVSVTDECIGFDETEELLDLLYKSL